MLVVTLVGLLTACHPRESWQLGNVQGELPDLQFTLTADSGETVTQANYAGDVTHSSAIYIFDAHGHARLLATESDPTSAFVHDLRQLVNESA